MPNSKETERATAESAASDEKVIWSDVLSLGIGTAGLLLAEVVINNFATYLLEDIYLNIIPVMIFMGISLGNLIFHVRKLSGLSQNLWALISSILTVFSVGAFCFEPQYGLLWAVLPFMGYGAYLSACYAQMRLSALVIGFGVGGLALYLIMGVFFHWIAPYLALIAIVLPIMTAVLKYNKKIWRLSSLVLLIAVVMQVRGFYEPRLLTESLLGGFKGSTKAMPPIFTPLIRTDLFHTEDDRYIIVTNGRRFAVVASAARVEHRKQSSFVPSYDIPYLVNAPKKILVIGSAEGNNIISALKFNADSVVAVDINSAVSEIMTNRLREFSGGIYTDPKVKVVVDEGRHFVETSQDKFDLITLQGVQTGSHNNFINMSLLESHLLTKESLQTLWRRLTDDGCVWIEEYKWNVQSGGNQSTLVQSVLQMAKAELNLTAFDKQSLFVRYRQSKNNPNGVNRKVREGLLLCKKEITLNEHTRKIFSDKEVSILPTEAILPSYKFPISDEHPYFVVNSDLILWFLKASQFILFGILVFAGFSIFSKLERDDDSPMLVSAYSWSLFLIGAGFILLISAAIGPLSLYLGDPQLSTPVLFVSMYAFGIIGGLFGLRVTERASKWSLLFLALYIFSVSFILEAIKAPVLALQSTGLRVFIFVMLIAPIGVCAELPFIWLLGRFEGKERSRAYTIENLGTLLGVPIAIYIQLKQGFYATMTGAAIFYALAFLFLITFKFLKNLKLKLALLCLVIIGVGLQSIEVNETSHFAAREVDGLDRSIDCQTQPANQEIEVSFANADKLNSQRHIEVLVGSKDGCFVIGQQIPLYAIKRAKASREIIERERRALVRIQNIKETSFGELGQGQKDYVVQKFGPQESKVIFNHVKLTLIKLLPNEE